MRVVWCVHAWSFDLKMSLFEVSLLYLLHNARSYSLIMSLLAFEVSLCICYTVRVKATIHMFWAHSIRILESIFGVSQTCLGAYVPSGPGTKYFF